MKLGIIGLGVVGHANKKGFEKLGHQVIVHDIKLNTKIQSVFDCDIVFVCVPTPSKSNGSCDTSIVESVISSLADENFGGIIAIRSSVVPGTTQKMIDKYSNSRICFVPEFLRERCAEYDFIHDHQLLAVGTNNFEIYSNMVRAHGPYPKNTVILKPTEAEVLKYYLNLYASTRVTFANVFYEICQKLGCDYTDVKNAYVMTGRQGDMYLDVNDDLRGYGGVCLPKDTKAIVKLVEDLNLDLKFFETVDRDNTKFKSTVFSGMRDG